ncbi:hypothetical protein AKJ40_00600 [candidate division MSBL1 archaeon SCGC-AAA259M10]|nr:hypothetical protein AKJ40_00600 [candidate division MSBL1 archaeon SCGC-AAA259M10]
MRLREAYQEWELGKITDEEMEEIYRDYAKEVIKEQEEIGLDVVTDGLIRWYDPISHFARDIEGCEIDGLLRYFDTNFYFRKPVIKGDLSRDKPILKKEFIPAKKNASKILKPVLTGPYTLAKHSVDKFYDNISELVFNFADIISREVRELVNEGAEEVQINEPAILENEEEFSIFSEAFRKIAKSKKDTQLDLSFYFGDIAPLYEYLQDLPTDLLGLDFTYSPDLLDMITEIGSEKKLGLGLIDARNTKMEKIEEKVSIVRKIVPYVDADEIYLQPSCGLEFLPRRRALEKLDRIVEIADRAKGVLK